jgi:hypothetical protein
MGTRMPLQVSPGCTAVLTGCKVRAIPTNQLGRLDQCMLEGANGRQPKWRFEHVYHVMAILKGRCHLVRVVLLGVVAAAPHMGRPHMYYGMANGVCGRVYMANLISRIPSLLSLISNL